MKNRQQLITSLHLMSFDRIYTDQESIDIFETYKYEKNYKESELRKIEAYYAKEGSQRRKERKR